MPREHIESMHGHRTTGCGRWVSWAGEADSPAHARRKIERQGIGNYCRNCARALGMWDPRKNAPAPPDWQLKLVQSIYERLCKGKWGCDAGAKSEQSGPCAGCSSLFEIAEEMGVSNLLDGRIQMHRACLDSLGEASGV